MEIDKLYGNEILCEEDNLSSFGNMIYFPEMDDDVEAIACLPIEEVKTRLVRMGADPNVPFPAALTRMLSEQEEHIGSKSALGTLKDRSTKARVFGLLAYLRGFSQGLLAAFCYALMLLVILQIFDPGKYISWSRDAQRVQEITAGDSSADLDRNAVSRSIEPPETSAGDTNATVVKADARGNQHGRWGRVPSYGNRKTQPSSGDMRASDSPASGDNAPSMGNNGSSKSKDEPRPAGSGPRSQPPDPKKNYLS